MSKDLGKLCVEDELLKESLQSIIHTILFHRILFRCRARDVNLEAMDVCYTRVESDLLGGGIVDVSIEKFLEELWRTKSRKLTLEVNFYQVVRKSGFLFRKEENVYWERWFLDVQRPIQDTSQPKVAEDCAKVAGEQVRMILDNIISFVCEPREQDHLPSVSHSDHDGCFPFQIIFHGEKNAFLDLDYFTNYLSKNS